MNNYAISSDGTLAITASESAVAGTLAALRSSPSRRTRPLSGTEQNGSKSSLEAPCTARDGERT
jgi:hypothetical protein